MHSCFYLRFSESIYLTVASFSLSLPVFLLSLFSFSFYVLAVDILSANKIKLFFFLSLLGNIGEFLFSVLFTWCR